MPASGLAGLPVFGMVSLSSVGAVSDGHGKGVAICGRGAGEEALSATGPSWLG
jgi:hypothetical protein